MAETEATAGLRRWLATAGANGERMTHAELAARLGYSLGHVYRTMGGSQDLTDGFRGRFAEVFGPRAAALAFYGGETWPAYSERPGCNCGRTLGAEFHASDCPAREYDLEHAGA